MPRIALSLSYMGQSFNGWQTQPGANTVQDKLERALEVVAGEPVATICAGRTDAGVHGLAQVVHFDTPLERPLTAWTRGVNSHLPDSVSVNRAWEVSSEFHARFSALTRTYVYLIVQHKVRQSIWVGRAGWYHHPLDLAAMQATAAIFEGQHDFSSLRSSQCQAASPIRTVSHCKVQAQADFIAITVTANAFLHHMVRNLVGMLVMVGKGKQTTQWAQTVLESCDRTLAAPTFAADGLYLYDVQYPTQFGIESRQGATLLPQLQLEL